MHDRLRLKPAQLKKMVQIARDGRRRQDIRDWAMTQLAEVGYVLEDRGPARRRATKAVTAISPGPGLAVTVLEVGGTR